MNKYWFYKVGLVVVFLCFALLGGAKVKLPTLVSDGMVLQRGEPVNIWGTADPDETVDITFLKKKYKTVADVQGNWKVTLPILKAGGPYTMAINDIELKDILIGDVWVCSDSRIWNCLFHGLQIVFAMKYLRTVTIRWYAI